MRPTGEIFFAVKQSKVVSVYRNITLLSLIIPFTVGNPAGLNAPAPFLSWGGTYGNGVTTKQADKDKLAAAFDPTDDNQYDFSKSAAQDWWIERGATGDNPDITDV